MGHEVNIEEYNGFYIVPGMFGIEVIIENDVLLMRLPGSPPGYELPLNSVESGGYSLSGGPLGGLPVSFETLENGETVGVQIGPYILFRVDTFEGYEMPRYLVTPALELPPEKKAAFDNLYQQAIENGPNYELLYALPYPKYEFLRYLGSEKDIILHGSNNLEISEFLPIRKSVELRDASKHGNLPAIYGTHRGIWPMFFAVFDRVNTTGSIRNGPLELVGQDGSSVLLYQFSINKDWLDKDPWVTGAVYLLPRKTFKRLAIPGGGFLDEWASHEPVIPIAKLLIDPADFPFLDGVSGHDNSELLEKETVEGEIFEKIESVEVLENGYSLTIQWGKEMASRMLRYIELQRIYLPGLKIELHFEPDSGPIKLILRSSGAINHVYKKRLSSFLK